MRRVMVSAFVRLPWLERIRVILFGWDAGLPRDPAMRLAFATPDQSAAWSAGR
jgi:hypothetical protein